RLRSDADLVVPADEHGYRRGPTGVVGGLVDQLDVGPVDAARYGLRARLRCGEEVVVQRRCTLGWIELVEQRPDRGFRQPEIERLVDPLGEGATDTRRARTGAVGQVGHD